MSSTYQHWMRIMSNAVGARGLDLHQHLLRRGLPPLDTPSPDGRVALRHTRAVWEAAEELLDDPVLGMSVLRSVDFLDFGELGLVLSAGGSLPDILRRVVRYHRLISEAVGYQLAQHGNEWVLTLTRAAQAHWRSEESAAVLVVGALRAALGRGVSPSTVALSFDNPRGRAAYERFFRCPVLLADGPTRLSFDGTRVPAAHPLAPAAAVFEPVLDHQLQRLARTASWSQRVTAVIEQQLMDVEPTLGGVARQLHVSERSLQRHLGEEGTNFRQLLDDVRKALAQSWLHGQGALASCRSITELAIVLGFSTNAALTRAFYRWFDMPPSKAKLHAAAHSRRHP